MKIKKCLGTLLAVCLTLSPCSGSTHNETFALSDSECAQIAKEYEVKGYRINRVLEYNGSFLFLYEHKKTGAQVVVKANAIGPEEMVNIGFAMPLKDNKGTNHALEHCIASTIFCFILTLSLLLKVKYSNARDCTSEKYYLL